MSSAASYGAGNNYNNATTPVSSLSASLPSTTFRQQSVKIGAKDLFPDELDYRLRIFFIILYVIIIVLAVGGNLLVFLVIAVNRKLRTVTNTFILSLAVSDILIAALNMPLQLLYYIKNEWTLGWVMCKLSRYLQGVVIVSSILTLTGIAVDRQVLYSFMCNRLNLSVTNFSIKANDDWNAICVSLQSPSIFESIDWLNKHLKKFPINS
jgi:hypothetical protein